MKKPKPYNILRFAAWCSVLLIFLSVLYGILNDIKFIEINDEDWFILFKREYIANLVISPLWVLVAFFFNKANEIENGEWKGQKNQLLGLIKGKADVEVIDIREIIQNEYNQEQELEKMRRDREGLQTATVPAEKLRF